MKRNHLFIALLFATAMSVAADMTIVLRDGRIITVPVDACDILGISFSDAGQVSTVLPVGKPLLWLDASDNSTLFADESEAGAQSIAGGPVGLWKDKSGNSRHFKRPGSAGKPLLAADGGPAVSFSPGNALSVLTDFPAPVTIFYVSRQTGGSNKRVLAGVANNWLLGYWMGARNQAYFDGWVGQPSNASDALAHLFSGIIRGPGKDSEVWADGTLVAANQRGIAGPNGLTINASPYPAEQSDCMVSEIVVYDRALSDAERKSVENYLATKWKLRF